ncbi:MAG TPA: VOC family protein [Devosia sp.]|nr:VOC family protein [Devosia sp.]
MLPALVPELSVSDVGRSLAFYCDMLGFEVAYERASEGFAHVRLGEAGLMLDQLSTGRDWVTGPLEPPFGRGINIQIQVDNLDQLLTRLAVRHVDLFQPVETKSYRAGNTSITQRQFCVQDPDGYLLRFCAIM